MNEKHCKCGAQLYWHPRRKIWMDEHTGLRHFDVCPLYQNEIAHINLDVHEPITVQKRSPEPVKIPEMEYIPL